MTFGVRSHDLPRPILHTDARAGLLRDARPTILSMPRGPRLVRTASASALAASMLVMRTSRFFVSPLRAKAALHMVNIVLLIIEMGASCACIGREARPASKGYSLESLALHLSRNLRHHGCDTPAGAANHCLTTS